MARIQILELPEGATDDRPPFVLVIDQYEPYRYITGPDQPEPPNPFDGVAERIGARAVLVFEETVDIPANHVSVDGEHVLRLNVQADLGAFSEQVEQAVADARRRLTSVVPEMPSA